jgi:hypothetical protein
VGFFFIKGAIVLSGIRKKQYALVRYSIRKLHRYDLTFKWERNERAVTNDILNILSRNWKVDLADIVVHSIEDLTDL